MKSRPKYKKPCGRNKVNYKERIFFSSSFYSHWRVKCPNCALCMNCTDIYYDIDGPFDAKCSLGEGSHLDFCGKHCTKFKLDIDDLHNCAVNEYRKHLKLAPIRRAKADSRRFDRLLKRMFKKEHKEVEPAKSLPAEDVKPEPRTDDEAIQQLRQRLFKSLNVPEQFLD